MASCYGTGYQTPYTSETTNARVICSNCSNSALVAQYLEREAGNKTRYIPPSRYHLASIDSSNQLPIGIAPCGLSSYCRLSKPEGTTIDVNTL